MNEALLENFALAMIAILNPFGKIPVWVKASEGCDRSVRIRLAALVTLTATLVLALFLFFGRNVLAFLGLDLPAVQVGGGIVILLTGIEMLKGKEIEVADETPDAGDDAYDRAKARFRDVVVPLAIPILAGPGSIITATLFGTRADQWFDRGMLGALLLGVMALVFCVLIVGHVVQDAVGPLVLNVQSRIWGLLLTAIAAQMIIVGLGDSFPSWLNAGSPIVDDVRAQAEEVAGDASPENGSE